MSIISVGYIFIFLPLIFSLVCALINNKSLLKIFSAVFCVIILSCGAYLSALLSKPNVVSVNSPAFIHLGLEFSLTSYLLLFSVLFVLVKTLTIASFTDEIDESFSISGMKLFYSLFFLSIFAAITLFLSNNIVNFVIVFELYCLINFTIFAKLKPISKEEYMEYFSVNSLLAMSAMFFAVILAKYCGTSEINEISNILSENYSERPYFLLLFLLLFLASFIWRFGLFYKYFSPSENEDEEIIESSFCSTEIIFSALIFLILVIVKLFGIFSESLSGLLSYLLSCIVIAVVIYSALKLYDADEKEFSKNFAVINFCFFLICIIFANSISLKAAFFFVISAATIAPLCYICSGDSYEYEEKESEVSEGYFSWLNYLVLKAFNIFLLFSLTALPVTILFAANWYFAVAFFDGKILNLIFLFVLAVVNFIYIRFVLHMLSSLLFPDEEEGDLMFNFPNNKFAVISCWMVIFLILVFIFNHNLADNISDNFSYSLLSRLK